MEDIKQEIQQMVEEKCRDALAPLYEQLEKVKQQNQEGNDQK